MFAKRQGLLLIVPLLALLWWLTLSGVPRAQGTDDYFFEDDQGFQEDDPFQQQDEFGMPADDFTEGGEFIDESTLPGAEQGISLGGRQQQLRVLGEREQLPQNAVWGAGTGLLIGGWFALINQGTSRETQRSLGLGVVLGTLVGLAVGARSLIAPKAPQPVSALDPWRDDRGGNLSFTASHGQSSPLTFFTFTFRF